jgi:sulfide:quinone oxidoreductase
MGLEAQVTVVTPEPEPLAFLGADASRTLASTLADAGVRLVTGATATVQREPRLHLRVEPSGDIVEAERVVAMPVLRGRPIGGVPADADGFIPVDLHGLVQGERDVYAAGDATNSSIKQGGVAAQQADAAAEAIAARAGAPLDPQPFRPVLRGLLLTGSTPRYMKAEVSGGSGEDWRVSDHALWWPPSKIAGRRLGPYLALRHDELEDEPTGIEVEVAVPGAGVSGRAITGP